MLLGAVQNSSSVGSYLTPFGLFFFHYEHVYPFGHYIGRNIMVDVKNPPSPLQVCFFFCVAIDSYTHSILHCKKT